MRPSGRRRNAGLSPLALSLAFLSLFAVTAKAAVLGIDFGTLHIKAALIKAGINDVVLTKDSKRKEVAAIAFLPNRDEKNQIVTAKDAFPERAYGSDALALQGRFPSEVFPNLKLLLGLLPGDDADSTLATYRERYPALRLEQNKELGTVVVKSNGFVEDALPFSVEELVGMELTNIKKNAAAMAGKGSSVDDVVITIPPFYTAEERRAILKAAEFADFNVNALISDGLAIGIDFAKTRTFPEITKGGKPEYHLVFDMGAGSTSATLLRFQGRSVKDVGKFNKTVQEVAVVGAGWDKTLGGDSLNHVIMEDYVQKLLTKPVIKSRGISMEDVKSNGRAMGRFFKEAERARQILSANMEVSSSFEEILPDVDLRIKLSRADFEALTSSFAERVEKPIEDALAMAGLTMNDVGSIILHGGALRTPFVQSRLEKIAGDAGKLRSSVNPDESAVFGAAFKAAGLSPSFKVKEIRNSDIATYATTLVYSDKEKERRQQLFTPSSPYGNGATTKQVAFKHKDDFSFSFWQNVDGVERLVSRVESVNLTLSVQELTRKFGCEKDEISTKFSIKLSGATGFPEIVGASVSCEVEGSGKSGSVGDTVKDWLGFGKKKDQEALGDGEDDGPIEQVDASSSLSSSTSTKSKSASTSSSSAKAAEPPKKRTETINVQWGASSDDNVQPSKDEVKRMRERLVAFDASDLARYAREEALNMLESYTYYVRDFLENDIYELVSTQSQRDEISTVLQSVKEWMEDRGTLVKATEKVLKEKRNSLKKLIDPAVSRRKEDSDRPAMIDRLKKSLDDTGKLLLQVENQVEEAIKAQSSAAELAASSASELAASAAETASSSISEAVDGLADLEDAETTTEASIPKYTAPSDFNPYASIDLTEIKETYKSISEWLTEKITEQAALKPFEDPILRIKDLEVKAGQLGEALRDLTYKQMKASSKTSASSTKKAKASKTKSSKKAKSTSSSATTAAAEAEDTPIAGESSSSSSSAKSAKPSTKPVTGDESIDDLLGRRDEIHDEL